MPHTLNTQQELLEATEIYLKVAVSDFKSGKYRLAVLHASLSLELILKARLWKINQALVLDNIDGKESAKGTVKLGFIPLRLRKCGFPLDDGQERWIRERVCSARNQIAHFVGNPENIDLRTMAMEEFDFIAEYLHTQFGKDLRALVPTVKGVVVRALRDDLAKRLRAARDSARAEGNVERRESCPFCGSTRTMSRRDGFAYCHFCRKTAREIPCSFCSGPCYTNNDYDRSGAHDKCLENFDPPDVEPYWK